MVSCCTLAAAFQLLPLLLSLLLPRWAATQQSPAAVVDGRWGYAQFLEEAGDRTGCSGCGCGLLFDWTPRVEPLGPGCIEDTRVLASRAQIADYAGRLASQAAGVGERWGSMCAECDGAFSKHQQVLTFGFWAIGQF
eukprot:SAG31_NODE_3271_length_4477_cov_2.348561_4_plen_137_part_00